MINPRRALAHTWLDDVEHALRALETAGLAPSVRLVRRQLGRGKLTTVSAHLREIAAERFAADVGALPDPVLASLTVAADAVWTELAAAADEQIGEITAAADERVRVAAAARRRIFSRVGGDRSPARGRDEPASVPRRSTRARRGCPRDGAGRSVAHGARLESAERAVRHHDRERLIWMRHAIRLDERAAWLAAALVRAGVDAGSISRPPEPPTD